MAVLVKRHSHNSPPQAIERAMNFRGMLIADDDAMVLSRGGNAHYLAPGHYTPPTNSTQGRAPHPKSVMPRWVL